MLTDKVARDMAAVQVEATNGILDQVDTEVAPDQTAGSMIDAYLRDHTVKNDLRSSHQSEQGLSVGIGEHINGLFLEDDLRMATEVAGQLDLAIRNREIPWQECALHLLLARRALEAVGWILVEFRIRAKVGVSRGDNRDLMLGREPGKALQVGDNCFGTRHIEFPRRVHEIELCVDIPEKKTHPLLSHHSLQANATVCPETCPVSPQFVWFFRGRVHLPPINHVQAGLTRYYNNFQVRADILNFSCVEGGVNRDLESGKEIFYFMLFPRGYGSKR
jgi:hypothetical protein